MKFFIALFVGTFISLSFKAEAQNDSLECERLKFLAGEALVVDDYKRVVSNILKIEKSCGLDQEYGHLLLGTLQTVINKEPMDSERRNQYIDTILSAWERQENEGLYSKVDDLNRATHLMQSSSPDYEKADFFFQRGIKREGVQTHQTYLVYAYYATYVIHNSAEGDKKSKFKRRMLSDYLTYSDLLDSLSSDFTQETLDTYFSYVFQSCEEILPEVAICIKALPQDTTEAIHTIQQLIKFLETQNCMQSEEYANLVDKWLALAPNSLEAIARTDPFSNNTTIEKLDLIMTKTDNPELKANCQYQITYVQYKAGQYRAAYKSGLACTGEYKSKGLLIAAQSVAATANSCGNSTFDRKCNYFYAAQLAEQAGQDGKAGQYRARGPAIDCSSENGSKPIQLSCWGVTLNLCPE